MEIDQQVRAFVADMANIPLSDVRDDLELENDIDWSRVHEDEYRDFFEYFIQKFGVYVPHFDFKKYAERQNLAWYQVPFTYLKFKLSPKTVNIENITVGELIEIARKGQWDL